MLGFFAAAPILTGERLVALFEAGRIQVVKVSWRRREGWGEEEILKSKLNLLVLLF